MSVFGALSLLIVAAALLSFLMRGGLSLAMALSLGPRIERRQTIQATTYLVAMLSIAVQGLTFRRLVRWTAAHTSL